MVLHSDSAVDVATVSNYRQVVVINYHLDFNVDFTEKQIKGTSLITFKTLATRLVEVRLDTHETLTVHSAHLEGVDQALIIRKKDFTDYGTALLIDLPTEKNAGEEFKIRLSFTSTGGPGVCWLDPQQTAGKKMPFMYTQGQAACNRSFFPCQDTPIIKSTYTANVKVAEGFTPVMSASKSSYGEVANLSGDKDTYYFSQHVPIQVYLVAMAVGDLKAADIGPRSKVYAEPSVLEKARAEFDGVVEEFISTGERLFGPYVWGRYDILIMPPSFPYGGMENPCLTFVTPCILVGDKSLTDVVIHEISHSWFGNLVTNATWGDFWLNEGFTMFAQRRIMEEILGRPYTCLEANTGLALLRLHMDHSGEDHPLNKLKVVIEPGVDPDDTYNETPYEKGYCFVSYLQHLVGDVEKFDQFLKDYVDKFKYRSVVADDTLEYFLEYFPSLKEQKVDQREGLEFDRWLNTSGWPPYVPDLSAGKELTSPAEQLADNLAGEITEESFHDVSSWKSYQLLHFLDKLMEKPALKAETLAAIADKYPHLAKSHNAEICLRWAQICIKNDYQPAFPNIRDFLQSQGKQKYTLPIYKALMKGSDAAKAFASTVYEETKGQLHVQVANYVAKELGLKK
ncbi:aminopeptidase B-like [Haliotis asinina]|uniref:aminopeptidase B-like n=1 Tax=Haliotis asinina TaxID=109174 RepID=UPI0035322070